MNNLTPETESFEVVAIEDLMSQISESVNEMVPIAQRAANDYWASSTVSKRLRIASKMIYFKKGNLNFIDPPRNVFSAVYKLAKLDAEWGTLTLVTKSYSTLESYAKEIEAKPACDHAWLTAKINEFEKICRKVDEAVVQVFVSKIEAI